MDKFVIACCIFSFICGAFFTLQVEQGHGCTVEVGHGKVTTVTIGRME